MAKLAVIESSAVVESVESARSKYQDYKSKYGGDILIDQAIRLVDHWLDNQDKASENYLDKDFINDAMEIAFDIEIAALDASQQLKTKASREKYERINEILSDLRVLMQCAF